MMKRLLSFMLSLALILPTCIIPTMVEASTYDIESGVLISEDFETAPGFTPDASWSGTATRATEDATGNTYYTVRPANAYYSLFKYNAFDNFGLRNTVITLDLRADNPTAPFFVFHRPADPTYALGVGLAGIGDGNWYTYKIEIGNYPEGASLYNNSDYIKVYRKLRNAADSDYGDPLTDCVLKQGWGSGNPNMFGFGFRHDGGDALTKNPQYSLDNFAVIKQGKVTSKAAEFVEDGGNVIPVFPATLTKAQEADGNTYYTVKNNSDYYGIMMYAARNTSDLKNSVITLDLRADNGTSAFWVFHKAADNNNLSVGLIPPTEDEWYTYRIEIGNFPDGTTLSAGEYVTVWRKLRGASDSEYEKLTRVSQSCWNGAAGTATVDYLLRGGWGSSTQLFGFGYKDDAGSANTKNAVYSIDNFQLRKNVAYSGTWSKSAADITFDSSDSKKTAILASYDAGDVLKDVDFVDRTGLTVDFDLNVTAGTAASKLYVWNSLAGGKPILETPITID